MRKLFVLLMIAALAGSLLAAPAEAKKKRKSKAKAYKVSSTYDTPAIGHPDAVVGCSGSTGCATIPIGPDSYFVSLEIKDSTGLPTYGSAGQDLDGDNFADTSFGICGSTPEPVAVEPGYPLNIFIAFGPGIGPPACAPAAGTSGVVDAIVAPTADLAK